MIAGVYYLYRYQLLPLTTNPNLVYSVQDIINNKNKIFFETIQEIKYITSNKKIKYKCEINRYDDDSYLLIFNKKKNISVIKEDHTREGVHSYPFSHVFIYNNKQYQIIAIQDSSDLHSKTIKSCLEVKLEKLLYEKGIIIKILPIYKENNFWDFVSKHEQKIISLSFNIITPNMSNISSTLDEELKQTAKRTGTIETNLKFNADKNRYLKLNREDNTIDGLVKYTSKGGGDINMKIKGFKKGFSSNDYQKYLEIDELNYNGSLQNFKELMKDLEDDGDNR